MKIKFIYQIKSLIMCILKILTDLCLIKLKTRIKNIFVKIVFSDLVVKRF